MAGSYFCTTGGCNKSFKSEKGRLQHCQDRLHGPFSNPDTRYCERCDRFFDNEGLLNTHRRQEHNWCFICNKGFKTSLGLAMHGSAGSLAHANRHVECRVPGCGSCFKSPSGLAHHLESRTHNSIDRNVVTGIAQKMDIVPPISIIRERGAGNGVNPTPAASYVATAASWNGKHFECYLCHRGFARLDSLNAHLNSAAHDENEFKCPNTKCKKSFTLISGFVQHLESRSCGLANIKEIQARFDDLAAQFDHMLAL
ncbi:hypothetical protein CC2G_014900 [Coprinopsis cinerea AmutBmut pab1-1]|nr:hypothetical protein CC2G_014900 [Coprinopsis cinerea AmutBmut pab1-1]